MLSPDVMAKLVAAEAPPAPKPGIVAPAEAMTLAAVADESTEANDPSAMDVAPMEVPHRVAARSDDNFKGYSEVGVASWYGSRFHGRPTADGETFNRLALTAAHPSMPLPSYVRVTNLENNRSITVRVNDRGPYVGDRLIDVSEQTAELLAFRRHGVTKVRVDYISKAPVGVDDGLKLLATYRGPSKPNGTLAAQAAPPMPTRVAFAEDEDASRAGEGAMDQLTKRPSVLDRILMAFDAAGTAEN